LTGGLDINTVDRGVTSGIARPSGGGNFLFGFNSLVDAQGAVALHANQTGFAPMPGGASIRGAIQRGPSAGTTEFSPFFFVGGQGVSVNDSGYLLGLSDDDPSRIVLRKGSIALGAKSVEDSSGLLGQSEDTFLNGEWLHLRLDMIVNLNGDVILSVFQNDIDTNPIGGAFDWQAVAGLNEFTDDALGVNSGSPPFTSGYGGFGMRVGTITRRSYFDHIELRRQV
jgi:hypothetical protein